MTRGRSHVRPRSHRINTEAGSKRKLVIGDYILGKTIGEGSFGQVKLAKHIITKEFVAVKILEKSKIQTVAELQRVNRETKILKLVQHKNVIQLYELIETASNLYFITEKCDGGELFDYVVKNIRLKEDEARVLFYQLIQGVQYLHSLGISHRDLKLENLLLQSCRGEWCLKIIDFGLSNITQKGKLLHSQCGSPCYAAPEILTGRPYAGELSDVWSMGVILFTIVTGFLPFEDKNHSVLYKKISAGKYKLPDNVSQHFRDLISRIFIVNPIGRITFPEMVYHPWLVTTTQRCLHSFVADSIENVDATIIQDMVILGMNEGSIRQSLNENSYNRETATYRILNRRKLDHIISTAFCADSRDPVSINNQVENSSNTADPEEKNVHKTCHVPHNSKGTLKSSIIMRYHSIAETHSSSRNDSKNNLTSSVCSNGYLKSTINNHSNKIESPCTEGCSVSEDMHRPEEKSNSALLENLTIRAKDEIYQFSWIERLVLSVYEHTLEGLDSDNNSGVLYNKRTAMICSSNIHFCDSNVEHDNVNMLKISGMFKSAGDSVVDSNRSEVILEKGIDESEDGNKSRYNIDICPSFIEIGKYFFVESEKEIDLLQTDQNEDGNSKKDQRINEVIDSEIRISLGNYMSSIISNIVDSFLEMALAATDDILTNPVEHILSTKRSSNSKVLLPPLLIPTMQSLQVAQSARLGQEIMTEHVAYESKTYRKNSSIINGRQHSTYPKDKRKIIKADASVLSQLQRSNKADVLPSYNNNHVNYKDSEAADDSAASKIFSLASIFSKRLHFNENHFEFMSKYYKVPRKNTTAHQNYCSFKERRWNLYPQISKGRTINIEQTIASLTGTKETTTFTSELSQRSSLEASLADKEPRPPVRPRKSLPAFKRGRQLEYVSNEDR